MKYQKHELLGKKFGQLTVIEQLPTNSHGEKKWLCVCDCGNKHEATSYNLAHGKTTRCAECSYKAMAKKNITEKLDCNSASTAQTTNKETTSLVV